MPAHKLSDLPPSANIETTEVLKVLNRASRALAEVKGVATGIPNENILIDTLFLQEALASSEIENIVTTQDELFQIELEPNKQGSAAAKEVARYRDALRIGHNNLRKDKIISNNTLIEMFQCLKQQSAEFRTHAVDVRNENTGDIIYQPPQSSQEVIDRMTELEKFINDDKLCDLDPLIKMPLIHHQFESIHPFSDGNGRVGRMLNVLYLTRTGLLDTPILYLSREITRTKPDYYRLLQSVREEGNWEEWVVYMLGCVAITAVEAHILINRIKILMANYKHEMRTNLPKIYSQDLLNNLFRHPYTRIEFVQKDTGKTRQTAKKYLEQLVDRELLQKTKSGRNNYYINAELVRLLLDVSRSDTR